MPYLMQLSLCEASFAVEKLNSKLRISNLHNFHIRVLSLNYNLRVKKVKCHERIGSSKNAGGCQPVFFGSVDCHDQKKIFYVSAVNCC